MISTFELDRVKAKHGIKRGQTSLRSKVTVRTRTYTHGGPIAPPGPLKWSVTRGSSVAEPAQCSISLLSGTQWSSVTSVSTHLSL